jgi:methylmalonyl-CoA/ethylmalonyl-CoA epimerase
MGGRHHTGGDGLNRLATDLDHVAVAFERSDDAWPRYGGDLPAEWVGGGVSPGFSSAQVRYANGMKVEALAPYRPEENDFLARFLDRSGPGPHHLTFKVPDIEAAIADARHRGYEPVGIDLDNPGWKEAFIHPKQACGIVVQLAQSAGDWDEPGPSPLPDPRVPELAVLQHIVHLVADEEEAMVLFAGLLEGVPEGKDLRWPGGGRIHVRPAEPGTAEEDWLGDRRGRLHHLAFAVADPAGVPGAVPMGNGRYEVPPVANHGTRLVLSARTAGPTMI